MTAALHPGLEVLEESFLQCVCTSPGPFLTVYLPARQPGAPYLPVTSRLQKIVRSAAAELAQRRFAGSSFSLLARFEEFRTSSIFAGSGPSVIFRSPGDLFHLRAPAPVRERLIVATHPYITPLLPHITPEREFYILSVNTKHL